MNIDDSPIRGQATPIRLLAWGQNRGFNSEANVANFSGGSDLQPMTGARGDSPTLINPVRICIPHYGSITKAYLDFQFRVADNETTPLTMKIARGTFQAGSVFPTTSYSSPYIDGWHEKIAGTTTAYSASPGGLIQFTRLDITKLIPKVGDSDYRADGFVILICFDRAPKWDDLWTTYYAELQKFTIEAAGLVVP